jgi:hypothetical protein
VKENENYESARNRAMQALLTALLPDHFDSREHVLAILNQSAALGLIVPSSAWGGMVYNISPILSEITELVSDISDVLSEDHY